MLQVHGFETVTQNDIDSIPGPPEILGTLDTLTGTDADGTSVAAATIRLRDTGDERIQYTERRINELAAQHTGSLQVGSVSTVVI